MQDEQNFISITKTLAVTVLLRRSKILNFDQILIYL